MECIASVNEILVLVINISIVVGIFFLVYFYIFLNCLDKEIESIIKEHEKNQRAREKNPEGMTAGALDSELLRFEKLHKEKIDPLKRKRERIISKVPFLK